MVSSHALKEENEMSAHPDDDKLLQGMIDAARAAVPSEAQWRTARRRLMEHIKLDESERKSPDGTGDRTGSGAQSSSRRRWPRRVIWGGVGLAAAASILAMLIMPRIGHERPAGVSSLSQPFGHVAVARGECVRINASGGSRGLSVGEVVVFGDQLQVGPQGGLCLHLEDSTTLWLDSGAELFCVAPRAAETATVRLVRGEIRADVAPSDESAFSIETPTATLRVLGTQFHCRVLPALAQEKDETMKRLRNALQRAITVVTVLSGAIAVEAGGSEQILKEGQRAAIIAGTALSAAETVDRLDYTRKWLGEPGGPQSAEILMFVPIRAHLLHALWAVNVESGAARHVSDFVGASPSVVQQLGPDLALINAGSVLFAHFGLQPVGHAGRPFVKNQIALVHLVSGEKLPMIPLEDCNPLYTEVSPDRRRLAFVGSRDIGSAGEREFGLYVLDLETFELTRLLEGGLVTCPHWAPDSRWLAISRSAGYVYDHQIVLVDTFTGEVVETAFQGAGVHFPPDGQHLIFSGEFARTGRWCAGVPSGGNLFRAELPDGPAEPITFLPNGGAVLPLISPDGARVSYWEMSDANRLHVLELDTFEDRVVWMADSPSSVRWIDGGGSLAVIPPLQGRPQGWQEALRDFLGGDNEKSVTLISATADVAPRSIQLHEPALPADQKRSASAVADRLLSVFSLYRAGIDALDLHRIETGQRKLRDASARLSDFSATVCLAGADERPSQGGAERGTLLAQSDLRAYEDVLARQAEMPAAERIAEIVRKNLYSISSLLSSYHRENGGFPPSIEQLAEWAAGARWQIDHIRSGSEQARRLFLIPGDDADVITTSFRLIETGPEEGRWVVQTPVLPDGRQYVGTYRYIAADSRVEVVLGEAR